MKTYCVVHRLDETSAKIKEYVCKELEGHFKYDEKCPKLCIAIGGDGTLLYAIHRFIHCLDHVEFIGLHSGTLGFFSDYCLDEVDDLLTDLKTKDGFVSKHPLIEAITDTNKTYYGVNEVRLEDVVRAQTLDVYINGEYLESFRGNGMLVCGQLGSTAYNRTLNGSIVSNEVEALQLTEIAGLNHGRFRSYRSSILFKDTTEFRFENRHFKGVSLLADQYEYKLDQEKSVIIKKSNLSFKMLRFKQISYIQRLKTLL